MAWAHFCTLLVSIFLKFSTVELFYHIPYKLAYHRHIGQKISGSFQMNVIEYANDVFVCHNI